MSLHRRSCRRTRPGHRAREYFVTGVGAAQRVRHGAGGFGDDERIAGISLGIARVQISDPTHRQPGRYDATSWPHVRATLTGRAPTALGWFITINTDPRLARCSNIARGLASSFGNTLSYSVPAHCQNWVAG